MKLTGDRILVFVILMIVVLSLILPKNYFWKPAKGIFITISAPIQKVVSAGAGSVYNFFTTIGNISELSRENRSLQEEINRLLEENVKLAEVEKENEALRAQLDFQKRSSFKVVSAEIIAKDPTNIQKVFEISAGKKQGIKVGMPVITSGILIGKVSEVYHNSAKVLLVTNPNSIVNGMLQKTRALGLVKGQLGFGLMMDSVPQDVKINIGDLVVTSGLGGSFPKGLLLGEVSEIISKQGEIFQSANLRPAADFSKLEIVFVIVGVK